MGYCLRVFGAMNSTNLGAIAEVFGL